MENFVEKKFGADKLEKLNNMHQGGKNNEKGNRLEDRFAVFKIISLAPSAITDEPNVRLLKQDKGFVDDIVIIYPDSNKKENYQAKDVQNIAWSAFIDNFKMQYSIDIEHLKYDESWTNALFAQKTQHDKLSKKIPEDIKNHTQCVYFPNDESLPALILNHEPLKIGLAKLSKKKNDISHYETIFAQILGQWGISETGSVADILEKSKENARPNLFAIDKVLDFDTNALVFLDEIKNLTYSLDNDELNISYNGMNLLLSSYKLDNVKECEFLLKETQPKTMLELINIWKSLSKVCK